MDRKVQLLSGRSAAAPVAVHLSPAQDAHEARGGLSRLVGRSVWWRSFGLAGARLLKRKEFFAVSNSDQNFREISAEQLPKPTYSV